ncbi:MAG: class I SAM-dependent methyltransferase [Bacteroidetes bacterium]|nr:class I SAM-dependent methyltransferase [Bacteroidota bacterium]
MNLIFEYIQYPLKTANFHPLNHLLKLSFTQLPKSWRLQNRAFKRNKSMIAVRDFGAGSKKLGKERSVNKIYSNSKTSRVYQLILVQIVKKHRPKHILELGTSLGVGTRSLASLKNNKVSTVEGCQNTLHLAEIHLKKLGIENVDFYCSSFLDFLSNSNHPKYDLVYIDGHHDGEYLKIYLEKLKKICHPECVFICDDIRWSNSMFYAYNTVQKDFQFKADYFRMGLLSNAPIH